MAKTLNYTSAVGASTVNLMTILRAAGWLGSGLVTYLAIFNPSGAVLAYIHLTDQGTTGTAPATGTDGWPIGGAAGAVASNFVFTKGDMANSLDLNTTWIHFPSQINVKILVAGN